MTAEWVTLKELEWQEQVALSQRRIQEEITRLGTLGVTVEYDDKERWLVGTAPSGAASIIARLPKPNEGSTRWSRLKADLESDPAVQREYEKLRAEEPHDA